MLKQKLLIFFVTEYLNNTTAISNSSFEKIAISTQFYTLSKSKVHFKLYTQECKKVNTSKNFNKTLFGDGSEVKMRGHFNGKASAIHQKKSREIIEFHKNSSKN